MSGQAVLLNRQRPTTNQAGVALCIAALFTAAFLAAFPYRNIALPKFDGFIPAVETVMSLGDIFTATLLFSQASATRSRALLALAAGYLFSGLIAIPHILAFPGAFGPEGLLGGNVSTAAWLIYAWRIAIPLGAFAYALLANRPWPAEGPSAARRAIAPSIAAVVLLVLVLTVLVVMAHSFLPPGMEDSIYFTPRQSHFASLFTVGVSLVAMALVWRRQSSILDLWLLLVLWAVCLELCMNFSVTGRFLLGWYVLKGIAAVSNLLVLLLLLTQTNALYLRLIAQAAAQEREQQRQLLVRDAIAASIAHEMRQPLAAIHMNAEVALEMPPGEILESGVLQSILSDTQRAIGTVAATRDLYKRSAENKAPADINRTIHRAVAAIRPDLRRHGATTELALAEGLPPVVIDRLQMQQVFLNLFMNAAEAMSVHDGPRILTVESELRGEELVIRVQDTGPGIAAHDRDRIFAPFVTTKDTGTGLGLVICQSVVEGHGGSLRLAQHSGEGALFEIQLPCARPAAPAKANGDLSAA